MKLREPTRQEKTALNRSFDKWGVYDFFLDKQVMVTEGDTRLVCLVSPMLGQLAQSPSSLQTGLVLGELKKNFSPTMAAASLFASRTTNRQCYVKVNGQAEQLVLYGRDVMGNSVLDSSETLQENELVIIVNSRNDAIGIGRTRYAGNSLRQPDKVTISTVADAGLYLRDEG
jgi:ribosome biogenesis protein Nip4